MLATFQHLLPSYVPIYHLCKANLGQLQQLQGVKLAIVNMYLMKCSHRSVYTVQKKNQIRKFKSSL